MYLMKVLRLAQVLHLMSELLDQEAVVRFACSDGSDALLASFPV